MASNVFILQSSKDRSQMKAASMYTVISYVQLFISVGNAAGRASRFSAKLAAALGKEPERTFCVHTGTRCSGQSSSRTQGRWERRLESFVLIAKLYSQLEPEKCKGQNKKGESVLGNNI